MRLGEHGGQQGGDGEPGGVAGQGAAAGVPAAERGEPAAPGERVGDHVDVDVLGAVDGGLADAGPGEEAVGAAAPAGAEDELGGVAGAGEGQQRLGDVVADHHVVTAAEGLDQAALFGEPAGRGAGQAVAAGDVHGEQFAAGGAVADPGGAADQGGALRSAGEGDDHAFAGLPHPVDVVHGPVVAQPFVDPAGQPEQREFAQRGEVADPEPVGERGVDLLGPVDVAMGEAAAQRLRGHVDQFDLVGAADHLVGDGLALRHAGDLLHHVVERLQVLDVDGGDHVDAGGEEFLDVLPALGVPPAGDVGVGEFVDQGEFGSAAQQRVQVEFGELGAAVAPHGARELLQAVEQAGGARPVVGLQQADHHVGAAFPAAVRLVEHPVGLADAGGRAEVDP